MGNYSAKTRILVAPLDWGLGHATRCIPLVRELARQGFEPWLAGEGAQAHLLKTEFPDLPLLSLPGYRVRYARTARGFVWKMLRQWAGLEKAIRREHDWLVQAAAEHDFRAIISDNRYGLWHPVIPSFFITHQLTLKNPLGKRAEKWLQRKNYRYIGRFTECWIPDHAGSDNLAGELSHPAVKPGIPYRYIGPLSRFTGKKIPEKKDHLLVLLSGPEPQRSILENKLIPGISRYHGSITVVRGLPDHPGIIPSTNMIRFYNHLPAAALEEEMAQAEWVISRSGYSTIMDLVMMGKKSILVPTPGQPEQEYLAAYLKEKKITFPVRQNEFSLETALRDARLFDYRLPGPLTENKLMPLIEHLRSRADTRATVH